MSMLNDSEIIAKCINENVCDRLNKKYAGKLIRLDGGNNDLAVIWYFAYEQPISDNFHFKRVAIYGERIFMKEDYENGYSTVTITADSRRVKLCEPILDEFDDGELEKRWVEMHIMPPEFLASLAHGIVGAINRTLDIANGMFESARGTDDELNKAWFDNCKLERK